VAECKRALEQLQDDPQLHLQSHVAPVQLRLRALLSIEAAASRGMSALTKKQAELAQTVDLINVRQDLLSRLASLGALSNLDARLLAVEQGQARVMAWRGIQLDALRFPNVWPSLRST
jgi:hypothetical protein